MTSAYPTPDRSDFAPNLEKSPENEALDLGYAEGAMRDGRPYRAEFWCMDQISMLTFWFSTVGLEGASHDELADRVESEGLVTFRPGRRSVACKKVRDAADQEMWSVNVTVGDEDETYLESSIELRRYANAGRA